MIECKIEGVTGEGCRLSSKICLLQDELKLDPSLATEEPFRQRIEGYRPRCLRTQEILAEIARIRNQKSPK